MIHADVDAHVAVNLPIRLRPRWARVLALPGVYGAHYRLLRRAHGRALAAWVAWSLTRVLLRP